MFVNGTQHAVDVLVPAMVDVIVQGYDIFMQWEPLMLDGDVSVMEIAICGADKASDGGVEAGVIGERVWQVFPSSVPSVLRAVATRHGK
ncbi:hypothetical protein NW768_001131 [Fusarium equiseti]|uniref:Uncharacterized protein n=1 Tax=Fusarium equiseti TaxID=61235 RepID=A0ABQ8RPC7_FUSEQ|nr:hypothetical protein NW768_001131 [Fusarium equiseti]